MLLSIPSLLFSSTASTANAALFVGGLGLDVGKRVVELVRVPVVVAPVAAVDVLVVDVVLVVVVVVAVSIALWWVVVG
jgi:hypothetical protein